MRPNGPARGRSRSGSSAATRAGIAPTRSDRCRRGQLPWSSRPSTATRSSGRSCPNSLARTSALPSSRRPPAELRRRGGTSSQRPGTATTGARRDMRGTCRQRAAEMLERALQNGEVSAPRAHRPDADRRALAASRALRGRGCCLRGCRHRARRYRDGRRRWRPADRGCDRVHTRPLDRRRRRGPQLRGGVRRG